MNLVGFSGDTSQVIRKVTLLVETHKEAIYSKMVVIDVGSTYNVILDKPWLHDMKVVPFSYHRTIKFLVCGKIEKIKNDQVYARHVLSQL